MKARFYECEVVCLFVVAVSFFLHQIITVVVLLLMMVVVKTNQKGIYNFFFLIHIPDKVIFKEPCP